MNTSKLRPCALFVVPLAGTVMAVLAACSQQATSPEALVKRGEYLVTIGSCNDCHTPWKMGPRGPEPDMSRMLSGHPADVKLPPPPALGNGPWMMTMAAMNTAFAGPWGISYTANLTPSDSGVGKWTEDMFVRAMRTGKHMGLASGRPIQPPMPWPWVGKATDEDLHAIFAYLKSIPPVDNVVPEPVIAPPPAAP